MTIANEWMYSVPTSSPFYVPRPQAETQPVPYVNPVQPYQYAVQPQQGNSGRQMRGLEPLAMLQQYRQAGSPPLEQQAALQAAQGTSTTGGK